MTEPKSHDEFFSTLSTLFDKTRTHGSGTVYLVQKRLSYSNSPSSSSTSSPDTLADLTPAQPLPLLIRASTSQSKTKTKLSTIVQPEDIEDFFVKYAEVCRGGMSGLKKRERRKKKGKKAGGEKKG
ncbi:signal recognition particle, SRP9/SRP14 subunit [Aulographum hederae CBS 113979]|uniref:Signal recognition particle subunit SRP14 n=1 Tax=Aulographum hederae CBS 113979 TaxID=1176131 RepID=A0A6G1GRX0_9PEZI|nr:signal recognition particle, SRP9/SRP14 subunit [Aulographum hederae CBS 113979]